MASYLTDLADLVLGRACLGCARPGSGLCEACLGRLRASPTLTVTTAFQPRVVASVAYDGLARQALLAYKEEGYRDLARPLGLLLADAIAAGIGAEPDARSEWAVVPVPPHRRSRRGFDALGGLARPAVAALSARGYRVCLHWALRARRSYRPLKGLGRDERRDAIAGAFEARRIDGVRRVVLVDDIITTGATTGDAAAALRRGGFEVVAVACLAAVASPDMRATSLSPAPSRRPS